MGGLIENAPTSEERILAAVSHAGVLLSPLNGMLPSFVWAIKSIDSKYLRHQSIQSLAFQVLYTLALFAGILVAAIISLIVLIFVPLALRHSQVVTTTIGYAAIGLISFTLLAGMFLYFALGLIGCIACLAGKDFRYPLIGNRLSRYLFPSDEENSAIELESDNSTISPQDRMIAGLAHASALTPISGLCVPLVLKLFSQTKTSFLRSHIDQSLIFQGLLILFLLVFGALQFFVISFSLLPELLSIIRGNPVSLFSGADSGHTIVFLLGMMLFLIINIVQLIVLPLMQTLALIAFIRITRGVDYQYPLLGKWLAKKAKFHEI